MRVEKIADYGCECAEAPIWHAAEQSIDLFGWAACWNALGNGGGRWVGRFRDGLRGVCVL